MVTKSWLLSFIMLCLVVAVAVAEPAEKPAPGISLSGVELKLGMKREEVIGPLAKNYNVSDSGDGWWTVTTKEGPPFEYLGSLEFKEGRLTSVSKSWGSFSGEESFKLGQELLAALQGIAASAVTPAILHFKEVRQPRFRADSIELLFDTRELSITIFDAPSEKGGKQVSIVEELTAH